MHEILLTDIGKIAYKSYSRGGKAVLFCGGYGSDMMGHKASTMEEFCHTNSISYTKFDYIGHGSSSGVFLECNISIWLQSAVHVLKAIKEEEIVIVGSSMGGWIALLLARMFPNRIKSLVGIAAAPDFTEDMYSNMSEEDKESLMEVGMVEVYRPTSNYIVTKDLVTDGRNHLLLNSPSIEIDIPISLFHAINDDIVDYKKSLLLMQKLSSEDVELTLVKNSDHSMNANTDLFLGSIVRYVY